MKTGSRFYRVLVAVLILWSGDSGLISAERNSETASPTNALGSSATTPPLPPLSWSDPPVAPPPAPRASSEAAVEHHNATRASGPLRGVPPQAVTERDASTNATPTHTGPLNLHSPAEIVFACSVLAFGLLLVAVQAFLALRGKLSDVAVFKLMGLTIIVTVGTFVIPAGFSDRQMSPLMGLLGAVAGYLLGKDVTKSD